MSPRQPEPSPPTPADDTLHFEARHRIAQSRDLTGATLGDFRVDRLLGRGGMGEVYLARQISLNREVAFKVLRPEMLANATYLARFESEAWAAAKLNDPNIVHIYSLGSIDGISFIAMEYVHGTTLKDYLQKKATPELMLALSIMRQAGSAVKAAGEMGLVHRDIKPENLLLTKKGLVKVADFGLCRDQDSDQPHVTQPGVTMGTPLYMSPEQAQGHQLDHRSDLYSLGVTFYHLLSGKPPFHADSPLALALKHVKDTPVDLSVHRPDLHPDLTRLVMKLIEKNPSARYQSAADMLRDLAKVRETIIAANSALVPGSTLVNSSPAITMTDVGTPSKSVASWSPPIASEVRSRPGLVALILFVALLIGCGVGWWLRPIDLLATNSKVTTNQPALWMVPNWAEIPKQSSPETQYRYAQLQADSSSSDAAWIAVLGYYPQSREWASRTYTQLARFLFRDHDAIRLKSFSAELDRIDRPHEKRLAQIVGVGLGILDHDPQGVANVFTNEFIESLTDPAFAELALEMTLEAERASRLIPLSATTTNLLKLKQIQHRLIQKTVEIMLKDTLGRQSQLKPDVI